MKLDAQDRISVVKHSNMSGVAMKSFPRIHWLWFLAQSKVCWQQKCKAEWIINMSLHALPQTSAQSTYAPTIYETALFQITGMHWIWQHLVAVLYPAGKCSSLTFKQERSFRLRESSQKLPRMNDAYYFLCLSQKIFDHFDLLEEWESWAKKVKLWEWDSFCWSSRIPLSHL